MCHKGTVRRPVGRAVLMLALAGLAGAQGNNWRRVGNSAMDLLLASPATGPVDKVWFSESGGTLYARTRSGKVFETSDYEVWLPSQNVVEPAAQPVPPVVRVPENGVRLVSAGFGQVYAAGQQLFRSEDGGRSWANLTAFKTDSVIGLGQRSVAVSPVNQDQIVVANEFGVWRSMDGGLSWTGLNELLPNLRIKRILATPKGTAGTRVEIERDGRDGTAAGRNGVAGGGRPHAGQRRGAFEGVLRARGRGGERVRQERQDDLCGHGGRPHSDFAGRRRNFCGNGYGSRERSGGTDLRGRGAAGCGARGVGRAERSARAAHDERRHVLGRAGFQPAERAGARRDRGTRGGRGLRGHRSGCFLGAGGPGECGLSQRQLEQAVRQSAGEPARRMCGWIRRAFNSTRRWTAMACMPWRRRTGSTICDWSMRRTSARARRRRDRCSR